MNSGRCNKLTVVHLVLQLETGGMEKLLVEFARHTDRSRFDLRFVSLTTRGTVAEELDALGWQVEALHTPPGVRPGLVCRLAALLRRWGADVVHLHNTKPLIYGGPAARLAGVRTVIYTRHGQRHQASRGQTILFRLASHCADRIVCVSDDSAGLSAHDGLPTKKICRIWNGIDIERFTFVGPQSSGPAVMVGRLSPEKDVETLIRAMARIVQARPSFRLEIAGDGVCRPLLEKLAAELGLENHVRFLGNVRDVAAVLARGCLFVLPSLTEGISLTLLEAMARGLPVVTTRVGGNPEVVAEGQTGLLVPPGNPDLLADAIVRMVSDVTTARRMGEAGRRRVEECFDTREMVRRYESLYEGFRPETRSIDLVLRAPGSAQTCRIHPAI